MRKKRSLFLVVILLITSFYACGNSNSEKERDDLSNYDPLASKVSFQGKLTYYESVDVGGGSNDGFYQLLPNELGGGIMSYIDYATQNMVVLCSRPECLHASSSCSAWFGEVFNTPYPIVWKNKLLLIFRGNPYFYQEAGEQALARIEICDINGANRQIVYIFTDGDIAIYNSIVADDESLYLLGEVITVNEENSLTTAYKLLEININEKTCTEVAVYPNVESMYLLGVGNNSIILKTIKSDNDNTDPNLNYLSQIHTIYSVDAGGATKSIRTWKQNQANVHVANNKLYLFENKQMKAIDLDSNEEEVLISNLSFEIEYSYISNIDEYLLLETMKTTENDLENTADTKIYLHHINIETQTIQESPLMGERHGFSAPIRVVASSDHYILVELSDDFPQNINHITLISKQALIKKTDYWKGIPDYLSIDLSF